MAPPEDALSSIGSRLESMETRMDGLEAKMDKLLVLVGNQISGPNQGPCAGCGGRGAVTGPLGSMAGCARCSMEKAATGAAEAMKSGIASLKAPGGLFSKASVRAKGGPGGASPPPGVRAPEAADLQERSSQLNRVTTKESARQVTPEEIKSIAAIFSKHDGDLDKIAEEVGADPALMKKQPPKDADDFADKLLQGAYTPTTGQGDGRSGVPSHGLSASMLKDRQHRLKHIDEEEKPAGAEPNEEDISQIAAIYEKCKGNLEELAKAFGAKISELKKNPPANARDFAKSLLAGRYSNDSSGRRSMVEERPFGAQASFGIDVSGGAGGGGVEPVISESDLKDASGKLHKVEQPTEKATPPGPSDADIAAAGAIFSKLGGDLDKIAAECRIDAMILKKNPPVDAEDFGRRLLEGAWTS